MLSKRPRPYDEMVPSPKRLAANVRDLFAENVISCRRTQMLINDMASAGVTDLPGRVADINSSNLAKNLRRSFAKTCKWPVNYEASIRVLDRETEREQWQTASFQSPLDVLEQMHRLGSKDALNRTNNMDPLSKEILEECMQSSGVSEMTGFGVHIDGVPHSWDREESCEVVSFNLPGVTGKWKGMRIPILALPHSSFGPNTWNDIMEVLAYFFIHMWQGVHPESRHDKQPFLPSEKQRSKNAGKSLRYNACVVEIRGDWKMLAETFHLPRWNESGGVCWSCDCQLHEVVCVCSARERGSCHALERSCSQMPHRTPHYDEDTSANKNIVESIWGPRWQMQATMRIGSGLRSPMRSSLPSSWRPVSESRRSSECPASPPRRFDEIGFT